MDKAIALWVLLQIALTMIFYRFGGLYPALSGLAGAAFYWIFTK